MRVRLLTSLSSPDGVWEEGDVYNCDDTTARRLFACGQAVPIAVGGIELAVELDGPVRVLEPKRQRQVSRRQHV